MALFIAPIHFDYEGGDDVVQVEWDDARKMYKAHVHGIEAEGYGHRGHEATLALVTAMAGMIERHGMGGALRTIAEIRSDIDKAKGAIETTTAFVEESDERRVFHDNCKRRIVELERELLTAKTEAKKPTAWEKVLTDDPSV
jgi:hypothetical protein